MLLFHIKPFFLPNDISKPPVSFLILHPKEIPGTTYVVTDSRPFGMRDLFFEVANRAFFALKLGFDP